MRRSHILVKCFVCLIAFPAHAVQFTDYGCRTYARWAGEVGKARDEGRHKSQMIQVVTLNIPEGATRNILDTADFLLRDIERIYNRPQGSPEVAEASQECRDKDGDQERMWVSQ